MAVSLFDAFINIKGDISGFQSSLGQAKSLANGAGSAISSGFAKLAKVGAVAWGAASTAVTAFTKSAISAGLSFDTAMGQVAATAGKDMDAMKAEVGSVDTAYGHFEGTMRDFAKFMGRNTAFSATQAAQALNYMALAGYDTQKSMNMLPAVLDMAAAGSMDLARASDMITDTQSALGLSVERTKLMVDEFAKAAATGNTSVEQLGEAFLTVGGLAKEANDGFITLADGTTAAVDGTQQLEIAFTAMANAGIKGSEAGTHMRNILLKLANPTKGGQEAFDKMGISIYDSMGNMKSLNVLFEELNAGLSKMSQQEKLSAIGEIFNARDTASAEALLAAVGQDWDRIGESILQAEGSASEMAKTKLDNLSGDITKFKSAMEGLRISISDGVNPALRSFVQLGTEGVSKITDALEKGDFSGAMDAVGEIINKGLTKIFDYVGPLIEAGGKILGALTKGIIDNIPKFLEAGRKLIDDFISNIDPASIAERMTGFVQSVINALSSSGSSNIVGIGVKIISAVAEGMLQSLGLILQVGADLLIDLANGIADALPELIPSLVSTIAYIAEQLLSAENISRIINAALNLITQLGWGLIAALPQLLEAAIEIVLSICEYLVNPANIAQIINTALQLIIQLAVGLINAIPVLVAEIPNIIVSIFGALWDGIVHTDWLSLGKEILMGLVKGMFSAITGVISAVGEVCSNIYNKIKNFFGIASPSKLMRDKVGKNIALGLADGLEEGTTKVSQAMNDLMGAATGDISGNVTAIQDMVVKHSGTIRIEGVNNEGEFVAASEYAIEEIITNIMKREARLA